MMPTEIVELLHLIDDRDAVNDPGLVEILLDHLFEFGCPPKSAPILNRRPN
jgi:hypothetical protein